MTKRKAIPARVMVSVAIRQANKSAYYNGGLGFLCPLCSLVLMSNEPRTLEHMTPHATMIALGKDPDEIDNLRWVHAECAAKKTNGTKATSANGDIHKIAKAKRLARAQEVHRAVLAGEKTREPSRIKGRGFDRTFRKRMNGKVERV